MDPRKPLLIFVGIILAFCVCPMLFASGHPQLLVDRWQLGRFYAAVADGDYKAAARYSEASEEEIARWAAREATRHGPITGMRIHRGETYAFAVAQSTIFYRVHYEDGTEESNGLNVFHGDPLPLPGPTIEEAIRAEYAKRRPPPSTLEFVDAQASITGWAVRYVVTWPDGRREEHTVHAGEGEDVYIPPARTTNGAPLRNFVPLRLS